SFLFFYRPFAPRVLRSFPTRRSSDLFLVFYAIPCEFAQVLSGMEIVQYLSRTGIQVIRPVPYPFGTVRYDCQVVKPLYLVFQSRSEEHTSELQSRENLVCRLLLEKKK